MKKIRWFHMQRVNIHVEIVFMSQRSRKPDNQKNFLTFFVLDFSTQDMVMRQLAMYFWDKS